MRGLPPPQKPCRTELTPLFEAAGAVWKEDKGCYGLYEEEGGLCDITEKQMYNIFRITGPLYADDGETYNLFAANIRTNFKGRVFGNASIKSFNLYGSNIEVFFAAGTNKIFNAFVVLDSLKAANLYNCVNLKRIIGILSLRNIKSPIIGAYDIPKLEDITIKDLTVNFSLLLKAPKVNYNSWKYMVDNASNTDTITITVHPDVYAKLMDEANTEWYAVNTSAQAKNIAFATTESTQAVALAAKILPEIIAMDGELLAPVGHYMTQASETVVEDRLFLSRKVLLSGEDVASWRVATEEERQEQEDYFKKSIEVYEKGN